MVHCTACDAPMPFTEIEEHPGNYETLCATCQRKAATARAHDQYYFEGLWWDQHWDGKDAHELWEEIENALAKT